MEKLTSQSYRSSGMIEVRFNALQLLYIDEALGRTEQFSVSHDSWYRLGIEHG